MKSILVLVFLTLVDNFERSFATKEKYETYRNRFAGPVDCFDAFENCRKISQCQAALRILTKKCKFENAKCNSDSDLNRCRQVKDQLFMYGFSETPCRCGKGNLKRCFNLHNKIYANPCFEEPRNTTSPNKNKQAHPLHETVEEMTTMDGLIDVTQDDNGGLVGLDEKEKTKETTQRRENNGKPSSTTSTAKTESQTSSTTRDTPRYPRHRPSTRKGNFLVVASEETIFGDEGFAKPRPRPHNHPKSSKSEGENTGENTEIQEITENIGIDDWKTETTEFQESTANPPEEFHYQIELEDSGWEMTTDMKYRVISIALGSILVVAILATMLYLAWQKVSKFPFSYKHGKIVMQNKEEMA